MTMKDYETLIASRMRQPRFKHSKNVAKEAVRLAKKYGADVSRAELAGILHDATKETPEDEPMRYIDKAGIILTPLECSTHKLWHAISGAAFVQVELGITDEDILNSIRYHTTGREGMSLLEKVIFIADFTSAERDYDGVDRMRKAADKSLEYAMLEGLSFTIADLSQRKLAIAPDTFSAYNEVAMLKTNKKK